MKRRAVILMLVCLSLFILAIAPIAQAAEKTYKIGLLIWVGNDAFIAEMTKLGYEQGKNITYIIPSFENVKPEDFQESYKKQIQAIIDAKADAFVTNTDTDAALLQTMTSGTPIIFARSDDPVATGAVKNMVKPGGSITGIVTNKPHERRLEILTQAKPGTKKVYYLYSTLTLEATTVLQQVQAVAQKLNVEIIPAPISDPASTTAAIDKMPLDIDWVMLTPFAYLDPASAQKLMELSQANRIGLAYFVDSVPKGYLIAYGPNLDDTARQSARILDRILRGGSPGDLPVEIAENYLTVNLEAAKAINLTIPESILRQANLIVRPGYFDITPTPVK